MPKIKRISSLESTIPEAIRHTRRGSLALSKSLQMSTRASDYLKPQVLITDITSALTSLERYQVQDAIFKEQDKDPIPEEYFSSLRCALECMDGCISSAMFPPELFFQGYQWQQNEDLITITYTSPEPISSDDIKITGQTIETRTKFVNGNFWGTVSDYDVKVSKNKVTIQLQVSGHWPILIIGGDMDGDSLFLLAVFAQQIKRNDISNRLSLHSAMQNHSYSLSSIALRFNSEEKREPAFYFYARHAAYNHDQAASLLLCEYLLVDENPSSLEIAENILIKLARDEIGIAFQYLGMLHLLECEGFNSDKTLAVRYFTTAAEDFGVLQSMETLGKCYIAGIGCKPDVQRGVELLERAGVAAEEILQRVQAAEENDQHSVTDYVIAGAVCVGAAALSLLLFKKFRRH